MKHLSKGIIDYIIEYHCRKVNIYSELGIFLLFSGKYSEMRIFLKFLNKYSEIGILPKTDRFRINGSVLQKANKKAAPKETGSFC